LHKFVVSIFGADRPGILAAVAKAVSQKGCNIENVSQTLLQDVFGGLLVISAPDGAKPQDLEDALRADCAELNLFLHVAAPVSHETDAPKEKTSPYIVTAMGPDRQGIVADVSACLAAHGVNITNMQAIFKGGKKPLDNLMIFEVDVPVATQMETLRRGLQEVSTKLHLEINLQHRKIFEAVSSIDN